MRKKGVNFFEEHIEKIVLVIIGLACIWLLITRVLIRPNYIEYDNKKFGPGDIDNYIRKEAEILRMKLIDKPEQLPPYEQRVPGFIAQVDSPIGDIDVDLHWPLPIHSSIDFRDNKYRIPSIGEVTGAVIEYFRTVAYVPTIDIDEENPYDLTVCEPNDIDFVTVEARFDVAGLHGGFYESFVGDEVLEEWRDPCLVNPVFAAAQLQRQELDGDGSWSEWQIVPRTKIDARRQMFESVQGIKELQPGELKVRMVQFDDAEVRTALLQPEAYKIASAKEEWFPPSLHKKYVEQQQEIELEKRRRAREAEMKEREEEREKAREEREKAREERRSSAFDTRSYPGFGGRNGGYTRRDERFGSSGRGREPRTRRDLSESRDDSETSTRRREREERAREREARLAELRAASKRTSLDDIYKELDEILITRRTDIAKLREPVVFWAHDDTIEAEKIYRYRIRLGVFNPIAGTNQVDEQDKDLKDQVILWSGFSDITGIVKIPGTLYFFPRDVQEVSKVVTVQVTVTRYMLGYWYSKDFAVKRGEVIGKVADFEPMEGEKSTIAPMVAVVPETIDYGTGTVLVDVVPVNVWSGGRNMYARHYYDMLYSFDGSSIEHIPVNQKYWDEELRIKLMEIRAAQKEPREPLRGWDSRPAGWELAPELEYRYEELVDVREEPRRPRRRTR